MIPYQEITFGDWHFYWGESVLFVKRRGKWLPVMPSNFVEDDDGERNNYRYPSSMNLETIAAQKGRLQFIEVGEKTEEYIYADPMEPFTSKDWITYEPPLGYFLVGNLLYLLRSGVPRSRHKGLHQHRMRAVTPIDEGALPRCIRNIIAVPNIYDLPFKLLYNEIARRMNEPFSDNWHSAIMGTMLNYCPVILGPTTAFIPEKGKDYGYLLIHGTLLGRIYRINPSLLEFRPRNTPSTTIEKAVNTWVNERLVESLS